MKTAKYVRDRKRQTNMMVDAAQVLEFWEYGSVRTRSTNQQF